MSDEVISSSTGYRGSRAGRYGTGPGRVQQGMDPDTRRLVMFAGGLGTVLAVLIGASALMGRHSDEIPVITADARPIREKPVNPGGMKIDGAENDVFSGGTDSSNARLAPAPESPNTQALRAAAAPPAPIPQAPAAEAPAAVASAPASHSPAPAAHSVLAAAAQPVPKPVPLKPAAEAHAPATAKSLVVATAARAPIPEHQATDHQAMVQLAALTSETAARAEWAQLAKKMPDLLGGRQPSYQRTERDGHTFWRVRTSGFNDVGQARSFCERVRAKGAGCSVAEF